MLTHKSEYMGKNPFCAAKVTIKNHSIPQNLQKKSFPHTPPQSYDLTPPHKTLSTPLHKVLTPPQNPLHTPLLTTPQKSGRTSSLRNQCDRSTNQTSSLDLGRFFDTSKHLLTC